MNRVSVVMNIHRINKWSWLISWPIVLAGFLFVWVISALLNPAEATFGGNLSALYIIAFISGLVSLTQLLPFALGFSLSRHDFFVGTTAFYSLIHAVSAVIMVVLAAAEVATNSWGNRVRFFHWPWLYDGAWWQQLFVVFVLLMFCHVTGFFIGTLFQRHRGRGILIGGAIAVIIPGIFAIVATHYGWWLPIGRWFAGQTAVQIAGWLLLVIGLQSVAAYYWLRRVGT